MLKRQFIVTTGWERCLVFYEDAKSDKRPLEPCRVVPDPKHARQAPTQMGHFSDILTAAMQVAHCSCLCMHAGCYLWSSMHSGSHSVVHSSDHVLAYLHAH